MSKLRFVFSAISAFTTLANNLSAETQGGEPSLESVRRSFQYGSLGIGPLPIPLPVFGVGHREQWQHSGLDLSAQVSTLVFATELKAKGLYHYYFAPNPKAQFYAGGGVNVSAIYLKGSGFEYSPFVAPELVFGKEYLNEAGGIRFFQTEVSWPTYSIPAHKACFFPLVIFTYGIGF